MSNNGFPSMTALLGLLAMAGYQNRDKIAEWMRGATQPGGPEPVGAERPGGFRGQGSVPDTGGVGGFLNGGLGELIDRFRQAGQGDTADSWVRQGPNQPVAPRDLEQAIGPDVLATLERQTGLPREELLARLSRDLPDAVDRYTPDGRLSAAGA